MNNTAVFITWPQNVKEFEAFVEAYQEKLINHAFFRLGSVADAEDIVQEVLVKSFLERNKLLHVTNAVAYIFRMTANACRDYRKKVKVLTLTIDSSMENNIKHAHIDASTDIILHEEYQRVNLLLSNVPAEQQEVLRYRVFDDLPFAEIAEILEIPLPTVKSRFRYGIEKVKLIMKQQKEVSNDL